MAFGKIGIAQAPSDRDGNEQFYILQFDDTLGAVEPRHTKEMKGPLSEAVIRDFLRTFGHSDNEIDEMFRSARAGYRRGPHAV